MLCGLSSFFFNIFIMCEVTPNKNYLSMAWGTTSDVIWGSWVIHVLCTECIKYMSILQHYVDTICAIRDYETN